MGDRGRSCGGLTAEQTIKKAAPSRNPILLQRLNRRVLRWSGIQEQQQGAQKSIRLRYVQKYIGTGGITV